MDRDVLMRSLAGCGICVVFLLASGCAWTRTTVFRRPADASLAETPGGTVRTVAYEEETAASGADVPTPTAWQSFENGWGDFVRSITGAKRPPATNDEKRQAKAYQDQAERLFKQGYENKQSDQLAEAGTYFANAAYYWPDSAVEEKSLFGVGECFFFGDRYAYAKDAYQELLVKYPNTLYLEKISLRRIAIAQHWLKLYEKEQRWPTTPNWTDEEQPLFDTFGYAIELLEKIRIEDPTGKLADDATMLAGNACFRSGDYERADHFYGDLRQAFPNSKHQYQAHLLGIQCKLKLYQGADYDRQPLDEAETLIKQANRLFPQEAAADREYLEKAFKEVRMNEALSDWEMAVYFDNRAEYRAAAHYYAVVARDFSDTSLAEQARQRLSEIKDLPPKPPKRLTWLTDLFTRDRDSLR